MHKEEVINIVKKLLIEAELQDDFSISKNTNELADIMIYKGSNGIDQLAINETPMFPFEIIENILFRRGEENDYCYNFKSTKLQIIFELKVGAKYVVEFGDLCINDMLLTKDYTDIYDNELIRSTLNDYSRQSMIREHVKRLFYIIAEMVFNDKDKPKEADVSEVKKIVWLYIDHNPQDADFIFSFAGEALLLRLIENDVFQVEDIIKRIVERREEDSFMLYLDEEYGSTPSIYLQLAAEAIRIIRKIKSASVADS